MTADQPSSLWTLRVAVSTVGMVGVWVLLTFLRPGVTFHLAPALVVWSVPFAARGSRSWMGAVPAAALGFAAAVVATVGLQAAGRLTGPVLFGGDGLGESLWVAAVAALLVIPGRRLLRP